MYVIPKKGSLIPDPVLHDFLPVQGRDVEKNNYWIRRLRDDDVVEGKPPKAQIINKKSQEVKA
ncbi:DUF2635 domain-containing protein [Acinetobacter guillouiae]|uniref:DUF2635 domain-containing protein n=1 Tax=Acinetobacter guillouiae TaxID=106649 RepID=UPI0032B32A2F